MATTRVQALQSIAKYQNITDPQKLLQLAGGNFTLAEAQQALGSAVAPVQQSVTQAPTASAPTTPTTSQGAINLGPGSQGEDVKELQNFLKDQGFFPKNQEATGYYGSITQKAVADWQKSSGLQVPANQYGYFGPQSLALAQQQIQPSVSAPTIADIEPSLPSEYTELLGVMSSYLDELQKRGQMINPNVEISPEKIAEFMSQASREIDPYYSSQLNLARESLLRDLGYTTQDILRQEKEAEINYGRQLRTLGESAAEQGFALSGTRQRSERELAGDTQRTLEANRMKLAQTTGTAARTFAQQYGGGAINIPSVRELPQVVAGQSTFQQGTRDLPLYELSPGLYEGLVGSKQYEQDAARRLRTSELESAFRTQESSKQLRTLTL